MHRRSLFALLLAATVAIAPGRALVQASELRVDGAAGHSVAIRGALRWDAHVPHEAIESTVSAGWVTLQGTVSFWSQRSEAERR